MRARSLCMMLAALAAAAVPAPAATLPTGVNPAVDISLPNFAYSPSMRKFVDSLPGLGSAHQNNLGQFIPIANPDTATYSGSDYYEIGLKQYQKQMHSDLPAAGTRLRGYYQKNDGTVGATDKVNQYLGPLIIAKRDRPVRIKFYNELGVNGAGDLPIPSDTTIMGAGLGPLGGAGGNYTENRANLHLHGGFTPWISDGTPHQWITPAGDSTPYKKGVSFQNVPDMVNGSGIPCIGGSTCFTPAAGDGVGTYYYPNQQSARLMFYHDHAYGITRLNVYGGMAAGYLLTDQVEDDLIDGTNVSGVFGTGTPSKVLPDIGIPEYRYGIPLIIQDRTFVNGDGSGAASPLHPSFPPGGVATASTKSLDPLWFVHEPNSNPGDFWFPHEYLPNENIYDPNGFWYLGRWDYGPWILPPMAPLHNVLPSPSHVPEAFMDTMVVNGTPFPYLEVPPTAVRFRILNGCNDRMLNLQLYKADPANPTEVRMVPASPNPAYPSWPKDGRDGGVPDPTLAGPDMVQIGNESGFLAQVAVWPPQPVDFDYDRTSATYGNVTSTGLYLPSAVRADVIVDFSSYQEGDTLILYNDAPAPMPLFDDRYDIFTNAKDWTPKGGAPSSSAGFGPNTRTVMQIRIKNPVPPAPPVPPSTFHLATLQAVLPKAFAKSQEPPLVPTSQYNAAYNANYLDLAANVADYSLNVSGTTQPLARIMTEIPGFGYTTPPSVLIVGGGGTGATATATLNGVTGVTLLTSGSGCTAPPTVTFTPVGGGTGATGQTIISGGVVTTVVITNPGSDYLVAPTITFTGGCTVLPTARALVTQGSVGSIILNNPGSGYTKAPYVYLIGGGGTGGAAVAMLQGSMVLNGKTLVEGMDMEYGRMNAVLGSLPNPLAPTVGAGPLMGANFYVDPPTEILKAGETSLWRISHVGVDSHAIHFHLFEVQLINRVDWTNTIKPPNPDEVGWKETIRTNPFEDIIVALRPKAMKLPFALPDSVRLLNPAAPEGTLIGQPIPPPIGIPAVAQITNVPTNFGWEYVWHCHLLGHEENDMMRPIVFLPGDQGASVAPTSLSFGQKALNSSTLLPVTLANNGAAGTQSLVVTSIAVTGSNSFTQSNGCGGSIIAGGNCTISVTFTPTTTGTLSGNLVITTNDTARPIITVPLSGTGGVGSPTSVTLTPSPVSPQLPGASVTFTAAAAGGAGNYEYEFYLRPPGGVWSRVRTFSSTSTWVWNTAGAAPGTYNVQVNARSAGITTVVSKVISYTLNTAAATSVTLTPAPASPQLPGVSVTFTAAATGGATGYQYEFYLKAPAGSWTRVRTYSATDNWVWNTAGVTAGLYNVQVNARAVGSSTVVSKVVSYTISPAPATSVLLASSPASPQPSGTAVTFTGSASGGSGNYEYEFWLKRPGASWSRVRTYSGVNSWLWNSSGLPAGLYYVQVNARSVGSTTAVSKVLSFTLN